MTGYSKYETGGNDIPTQILIQLAQFYGASMDCLLGLTSRRNPIQNSPRSHPQMEKHARVSRRGRVFIV